MGGRGRRVAADGTVRTLRDGGSHAEPVLEEERVARHGFDAAIAEDRGYGKEVDVGVPGEEQQRHGVIDPRIGVENDLVLGHGDSAGGQLRLG